MQSCLSSYQSELKGIQFWVYKILLGDKVCRNSDGRLFASYLWYRYNVDVSMITGADLISKYIVEFKSVERARRKVQSIYPYLAASPDILECRQEKEIAMIEVMLQ